MTFKQLEALYWVARLGGFLPAAQKLHTTQSAISKRVQELEEFLGVSLFDRNLRNARLTEKGEELFLQAKKLLDLRINTIEQISSPHIFARTLGIGVTEFTALTWLPNLVNSIQSHYPRINIEPAIDMSMSLREKLLADEIDLIIVPDAYQDSRFVSRPVGKIKNIWMCKPGVADASRTLRLHELGAYRLLMDKSGPGILYGRWFNDVGFTPGNKLISNSFVALLSLTVSGMGISYFPDVACLRYLQAQESLTRLDVTPALPDVTYVAMYKAERHSELLSSIIMLTQNACDFDCIMQLTPGEVVSGPES